jgi:hydrogenase maturation factor
MSGLKIAALYSFPPGRFGLCGMGEESAHQIFDFLLGEKVPKIKEILESFEGSLFYYRLIAKENKISDYFDERVIRAYWIGNELLEKVRISKLKELVVKKFKKQKLAKKLPENSKPHHSFHVLVAGPMKKDLIMTEGMRDLCKVSWGKVLKIEDCKMQIANLIVEYQPILKEKKWFLGKQTKRKIFWFKRILPKVKVGDFVSFHWDLALEKLSETDLRNLKKYTEISVQSANFIKKY